MKVQKGHIIRRFLNGSQVAYEGSERFLQVSGNSLSSEKSFIGQVFFFGAVQFITRLRALIILPILSRLIGTEGYGYLAALTALSSITFNFILLGTNTSLTVFIPDQFPEQRRRDFWGVAQTTFISGVIAVAALALFYPFIRTTLLPSRITIALFIAGILNIPLSALQMVLYAQIVNNRQGKVYSKITAITCIFELFLLVAGAYWFRTMGVLYALAVAQMVLCAWMICVILVEDPFTPLSLSHFSRLKKYYTYGLTMFVVGIGAWVIDVSDRLILGKCLSVNELGIYHVAYNLCSQLSQLSTPLFAALMPFVVTAISKRDTENARRHLEQTYKVLVAIFIPAVLLLSLNSHDIFALLTTQEFVKGAEIVPLVATGVALFQIVGVYTYNLHAHKRGQVLIVSIGCAAVVNLVLNLVFIPLYGIMAAAASTLVAYMTHFVIARFYSGQSLAIKLDLFFLFKVIAASAGMAIAVSFVRRFDVNPVTRLVITVPSGVMVYLAIAYLVRVFSRQELEQFLTAVKSVLVPSNVTV